MKCPIPFMGETNESFLSLLKKVPEISLIVRNVRENDKRVVENVSFVEFLIWCVYLHKLIIFYRGREGWTFCDVTSCFSAF